MKTGWIWAAAMLAIPAGLAAMPAGADVKAGVDAWARGDFRTAVEQWRGPAVAGDPDAQFNLGQAYKLGRGVPLDPALAESWFRKAALQGHEQAEDNYALALFVAGKKADAVPWLEKSVARGEARTQLVYGTMLFNGDGVPRDYPRAYALMTLAAQKGLKSAGETLAQMDQYVSPENKERGLALARQYAAQARVSALSAPARPVADAAAAPAGDRPAPVRADLPRSARATPRASSPAIAAAKPVPPAPAPSKLALSKSAATPRPATGGWRVQLGAFRDRGNAEGLWSRVRTKLPGAAPDYVSGGGLVRLQATGFATRAAAIRACAQAGTGCVVVAP